MVEALLQDMRYGVRLLRQSPTFTVVAIVTLALGIGATVGIFTVVNAVLLRPLPIREPERIAVIYSQNLEPRSDGRVAASWTKYEALRQQTMAFGDVGASVDRDFTIDPGNGPIRIRGSRVTAGFFGVLGISPALGRSFAAEEDVEGAAPVAVITDALWKGRMNGDPNVIGKIIRVEGRDTSVIGVLPADFRLRFSVSEPQVYLTCVYTPDVMTAEQIHSGAGFLSYVARLKPGATLEQARMDLTAVDARYGREHVNFADSQKFGLQLFPFIEDLVGSVRLALKVLMASVLFLLMIACANVAHLLLARSTARRREVAVRLALGASYSRIVRQFLTEALLLALAGAGFGILFARLAVTALVAYGPEDVPRLAEATPDVRVLAFAVVVVGFTAIVFGMIPALRIRSMAVGESLKEGRPGALTQRYGARVQQVIATSETAITVVLLIGAALLLRSLLGLQAVDPGFHAERVYTAQISLQQNKYLEPHQRDAFFSELLKSVQAQPGIAAAGATSYLPMGGANYGHYFFIEGQPHLGVGRDRLIAARHVSADYFRVMQMPIRRGRAFTESDATQSQPVAIVNERAVRMFFPNVDPIGQRIANSRDGVMREIVGVVGDVRFDGPTRGAPPELYVPYRQIPWPSMSLVVSSTLPVDVVATTIRRAVQQLDRDQAVTEIRTMDKVVAAITRQQQFTTSLLGTFAFVATALAAIGLYGVIAMFVAQRRQEFGIRMALGAQRRDVLRQVMLQGGIVIGTGTAIGLIAAVGLTRLLRSLLYGITPTEPVSYVIGAIILLVSGLLACYLPARRAMTVDPAKTLRAE